MVTSARTTCGAGGHRFASGASFKRYPFVLIVDELTAYIKKDVPWCMLFVDEIMLVDELIDGSNVKL